MMKLLPEFDSRKERAMYRANKVLGMSLAGAGLTGAISVSMAGLGNQTTTFTIGLGLGVPAILDLAYRFLNTARGSLVRRAFSPLVGAHSAGVPTWIWSIIILALLLILNHMA